MEVYVLMNPIDETNNILFLTIQYLYYCGCKIVNERKNQTSTDIVYFPNMLRCYMD